MLRLALPLALAALLVPAGVTAIADRYPLYEHLGAAAAV